MQTGELHITDVYQSQFTGQLILTVSTAVTDDRDEITGIIGADIQIEQLLRQAEAIEDVVDSDSDE